MGWDPNRKPRTCTERVLADEALRNKRRNLYASLLGAWILLGVVGLIAWGLYHLVKGI